MRRYIMAIDLGGTNMKIAVIKSPDWIIKKVILPTNRFKDKEELLHVVSEIIKGFIKELRLSKRDILGIGIGTPGLIDSQRGIIHYLVNIKGWKDVHIKKILERETRLSTFLDNDVNVMTLGELHHGAGKDARNMVCVTLGTGVGGGIVIERELYRGNTFSAGEIGHMPLSEKGPECNCGGLGCLERYVGNKEIVRAMVDRIKKGKKSKVVKLADGDIAKITPEMITHAARMGDKAAIAVWREIATHLGIALAGVVNLLNPEKIVIGGGVAEAGRFLFDPLRKVIRKRAMDVPAKKVKVVRAQLGQQAGLIGAAVLVRLNRGEL